MKLYIAGPMRGRQYYNFPAFDAARDALLALGYEVISPADLDREHGFDAMNLPPDDPCDRVPEGFSLPDCIMRDGAAVLAADGVCFIDGNWRASAGSVAEYHVALWARKQTFELAGGTPVPVRI